MRLRFQPWQLAVLVVLACVAGLALVQWWSSRRAPYDAVSLVESLPEDRSVHVFVNLEMLRDTGLLDFLSSGKTPEEPDYRKFVDDTGFDYRTDLDAVAAAFNQGDVYITARGQFEWARLVAYAQAQSGQCVNSVCQMPASRPERNISFYPLRRNVLALAVTAEPRGVIGISIQNWRKTPSIPEVPIWVSAPPEVFSDVSSLPNGTHSFLSPLRQTHGAVFTLGPAAQHEPVGYALRVEATSDAPSTTADIVRQLTSTTDLLRSMLVRDNLKASPDDLSGVLTSGHFKAEGNKVVGAWSLDRRFLDKLFAGQVK